MNSKRNLLSKSVWSKALGASERSRRLSLQPDDEGCFQCPVKNCDSEKYQSKRGCRKHVYTKHAWYYYFDEKPCVADVLPQYHRSAYTRVKRRGTTRDMPSFKKTCTFFRNITAWLTSCVGGNKSATQSEQIGMKLMKYFKYACSELPDEYDVDNKMVEYLLGCPESISKFVQELEEKWKIGFPGILGYLNALSHAIDYKRSLGVPYCTMQAFVMAEVYLQRIKRTVGKKMRLQWKSVLSVEYLESVNCWATLEELQKVIPYHKDRFIQVLQNATNFSASELELSFSTSFVVTVLFLMVKATRPMTFRYLTTHMIEGIGENGFIDQTVFKTNETYGFDTLYFTEDVLRFVKCYTEGIRPLLRPKCEFVLLSRKGTQLQKLTEHFGNLVFQAIGKYIHPTRYRQIVETESLQKLSTEEQRVLSHDQKHSSVVAQVHYQKVTSQSVAEGGFRCMEKLVDFDLSRKALKSIGLDLPVPINENENAANEGNEKSVENNFVPNNYTTVKVLNTTIEKSKGRRAKIPFSKQEDSFIAAGIKRYGKGKWTSILKDPEFNFHSSRQISTLSVRAKTLKLI